MKLALQIKLLPNEAQYEELRNTMSIFNNACNDISDIAWEKKVFSQYSIHKEVYYSIKNKYKLPSQLVIRAISKVAETYKKNKKKKHLFKNVGSVMYDSRILSYSNKGFASICLINGRLKIPYACHLTHLLKPVMGKADLVLYKGAFYVLQTYEIDDEKEEQVDSFIGLDMGITDLITTSEGDFYSGLEIKRVTSKYNKIRSSIQSKGTRNCHKLLKRLKGREHRFITITNHTISKQLVTKAKKEHKGIAIEDLKRIRTRANKKKHSKETKRDINHWSFAQLRCFLEYKSRIAGVKIIAIDPSFTSQTCNVCYHIGERNGKHFHCNHCGNVADADVNAAKNIAAWGYVNTHERWDMLSCSIHDKISTSKAHIFTN